MKFFTLSILLLGSANGIHSSSKVAQALCQEAKSLKSDLEMLSARRYGMSNVADKILK